MQKIILIFLIFLLINNCLGDIKFKPGEVTVTWTTTPVSVCPPGILGGGPCNHQV
jgi:hypothetical protein